MTSKSSPNRPPNLPVAQRQPDLAAVFLRAGRSESPLSFSFDSKQAASNFRFRLHSFRKELRTEVAYNRIGTDNALYQAAERVEMSISQYKDTNVWVLTIRPKNQQYLQAIRNAGVMPLSEQELAELSELNVSSEARVPDTSSISPADNAPSHPPAGAPSDLSSIRFPVPFNAPALSEAERAALSKSAATPLPPAAESLITDYFSQQTQKKD